MDDVRCANTWVSRYVCTEILKGRTYPPIAFVDGIRMIIDVGANVGAAAVYFSRLYPRATIHACEPAGAAYALLLENTRDLPNVSVWRIGLHDHDGTEALYAGSDDDVTSSLVRSKYTSDHAEMVRVRSARDWLDENNIGQIDLLKVDTEGSEVPILRSFGDRLASVKVLYVESHSDADRRKIDEMVAPTHQVAHVAGVWPTADFAYVRNDLFADAERVDQWRRRICNPYVDMLRTDQQLPGLLRQARASSG
jgi:FkbM family methyltransferase